MPNENAEASHETWAGGVDDHLDALSEDLVQVKTQMTEIGVVKRMMGALLPTTAIAAIGFVLTAYVAFDRLDRAQEELRHHREQPVLQAHPDLGEHLGELRETNQRILTTVESMQREAARRDADMQSRFDRLETRIDRTDHP